MASSASDLLKLELQANGENSGTWGTKSNTVYGRLEEAVAGMTTITVDASNYTLDDTQFEENVGTTAESHLATIKTTGVLTGNRDVIVPSRTKEYLLWNTNTGAFTLTIKTAAGSGVVVPQGGVAHVLCDGTNVVKAGALNSELAPKLAGFLDPDNNFIMRSQGADISSATATVLGVDGDFFHITGTVAITSFTVVDERHFTTEFDDILTLTHNGSNLILPSSTDIITAAGDVATFESIGSNQVKCLVYTKQNGEAVVGGAGGGFFKGNNGTQGNDAGDIIRVNAQTLTTDVTILSTENASATGPLDIADGITLDVQGTFVVI